LPTARPRLKRVQATPQASRRASWSISASCKVHSAAAKAPWAPAGDRVASK
jgi:hypothetical protein